MLHLFDAQRFIEVVAEAHQKLQQEGDGTAKASAAK